MEKLVVIVGFLGAGKTTLLRKLVDTALRRKWNPYIILNDYENASLDAQQFIELLDRSQVSALSGSCICCTGLPELRRRVNSIPHRTKPMTFIEANGTTDACALLGFLGVGLKSDISPPIQISVVDARNWQKREFYNDLEASQVRASSLIVLNYANEVSDERLSEVRAQLSELNSFAKTMLWAELDFDALVGLKPFSGETEVLDHAKSHWASCSVDLDDPMCSDRLLDILHALPQGILRVKACTRLNQEEHYSFVEKIPSGEITVRRYTGALVSGPKLLTIGPGSDPDVIKDLVEGSRTESIRDSLQANNSHERNESL